MPKLWYVRLIILSALFVITILISTLYTNKLIYIFYLSVFAFLIINELFNRKGYINRTKSMEKMKKEIGKLEVEKEDLNKQHSEIQSKLNMLIDSINLAGNISSNYSLKTICFHLYTDLCQILCDNSKKGVICIFENNNWTLLKMVNESCESELSLQNEFDFKNLSHISTIEVFDEISFLPKHINFFINNYLKSSQKLFLPIINSNKKFLSFIFAYSKPTHINGFINAINLIRKFISYGIQNQLQLVETKNIINSLQNITSYIMDQMIFKKQINKISNLSVMLAHKMGISADKIDQIYVASHLIDIGYIKIPKSIINKPNKLTPQEFDIIKQHPLYGYELINKFGGDEFDNIANIIKYHHERWDGTGYPLGLAGVHIPVEARIIAVADSFVSMTTERPYRKALSIDQAMNIILKNSSIQFDPKAVYYLSKIIQNKDATM